MNDELKKLKKLVRQFLRELRWVPFRAIDCDQIAVEELWLALEDATKPKRRKKRKNANRN